MAHNFATAKGLILLAIIHVTMSIAVEEFFPDVKGNLTKITWAHATNSQEALKKVLKSDDIMMIEADVVMGTLNNATAGSPNIPIMAHPPANTSDLSLEDFIKQVTTNKDKKKGFKLDFKTIEAFENSLPVIQKIPNITVPVWLNADILPGPINTATPLPVDAKRFLVNAAQLPQTLLSIGWTTRLEEPAQNVTTGKYTTEQINEMVKVVQDSKTKQSITYPVRACFAANDEDGLKSLLDQTASNNSTLTIWSSEDDKVDANKLSAFIKKIGLDKVFVDVPMALRQKLNLSNGAFTVKSSLIGLVLSFFIAMSSVKLL